MPCPLEQEGAACTAEQADEQADSDEGGGAGVSHAVVPRGAVLAPSRRKSLLARTDSSMSVAASSIAPPASARMRTPERIPGFCRMETRWRRLRQQRLRSSMWWWMSGRAGGCLLRRRSSCWTWWSPNEPPLDRLGGRLRRALVWRSRARIDWSIFGGCWPMPWKVGRRSTVSASSGKRKLDPRFARCHEMVSAPELWDAQAVRDALALLAKRHDAPHHCRPSWFLASTR